MRNCYVKGKVQPESMPQSGKDLKQALRQALEQATPLDDFVQVIRDLTQYEIRHGMNSGSFFARSRPVRWAKKSTCSVGQIST